MHFTDIATRITGFSTPLFGVSWNPPAADVAVARKVLTFLEDRRVLFNPSEAELPEHCIHSVLDIRRFLTDVMMEHGQADELQGNLRAMRAACRRFLDELNIDPERKRVIVPQHHYDVYNYGGWVLNQALGELRGVFGIHVAQIAVKYGLDVEDPLATIIPADPDS